MKGSAEISSTDSSEKTVKIALKIFFNIIVSWNVEVKDQITLIGQPDEPIFYHWKKGRATELSPVVLEHISHIIGIYALLGTLFSTRSQADLWLLKPNKSFNGESALSFILKDSLNHLSDVRMYLKGQIQI